MNTENVIRQIRTIASVIKRSETIKKIILDAEKDRHARVIKNSVDTLVLLAQEAAGVRDAKELERIARSSQHSVNAMFIAINSMASRADSGIVAERVVSVASEIVLSIIDEAVGGKDE
jgi:hypothetical protein